MKRIVDHITQRKDGKWQVKTRGAKEAWFFADTKELVLSVARYLHAMRFFHDNTLSQLIIHLGRNRRSLIETEHTYGNDPRRYKG